MSKTVCLLSVFPWILIGNLFLTFLLYPDLPSHPSSPFFWCGLLGLKISPARSMKFLSFSLPEAPWTSGSHFVYQFFVIERECQTCFCFFPFISFIWKQLYLQFAFLQLSFGTVLFTSYRASLCFKTFCSYCPGNLHSSKNYPSGFYVCCTGWILSAA